MASVVAHAVRGYGVFMDAGALMVETLFSVLRPLLPWLIALLVLKTVASFPMPGRGPVSGRRDVWRGFKFGARATVMERAGGRCEGAEFLIWGRCPDAATEVDHVFPYSSGGPTVVSNGQALCSRHNRRKGHRNPPWWYVLGLEKRRRAYFPQGADVRVFAVMSQAEVHARDNWLRNRARGAEQY